MPSDLWLVRSHKNKISRPMTQESLFQWAKEGKLSLNDELCQSGGYWFALSDREQVKAYLGEVVFEFFKPKSEENTVTNKTVRRSVPEEATIAPNIPKISSKVKDRINADAEVMGGKPIVLGKGESSTLWKPIIWALTLIAIGVFIGLIYLIQSVGVSTLVK